MKPRTLNPQFSESVRIAWVSDRAREVWEPRFQRIATAWTHVAWLSVVAGLRRCAILHLTPESLAEHHEHWDAHGLVAMTQRVERSQGGLLLRVVVGAPRDLLVMQRFRERGDQDGIGRLLGYPPCCRAFFARVWDGLGVTDTTWEMAKSTAPGEVMGLVELEGPSTCNILHRWMGVRAVHHLPCSFDCEATDRLGLEFLRFMRDVDASEEADWIEEILSWPVEWSALHGVAEIRSPIMKLVVDTDPTPGRLEVRWNGPAYPDEGARGLRFPYTLHRGGRAETGERPQREMALQRARRKDWYYGDNGFGSLEAMEAAHAPIVALANEVLHGRTGAVLDLGCGNASLLNRICTDGARLTPFGIDSKDEAIRHARQLLPQFADNLICGDMFFSGDWLGRRRYLLGLLMPGRLLEQGFPLAATDWLTTLKSCCDQVLVYAYPSREHDLKQLAASCGFGLSRVNDHAALAVFDAQASTIGIR